MRNSLKVLIPSLAVGILLSACGSSASSTSSVATPNQPAAAVSGTNGSSDLVKTSMNSKLGATVLVDAQGLTLYRLSGEQSGKFICTSAACVQVWHPLTLQGAGKPSGTVGSLGAVKRPGGAEQVTYKGMPLYTFAQDMSAGQANGQGVKDVGIWNAVTTNASTASVPAPAPAPSPAPASSGGGGSYGY
jgi:predicted lipoprotein with Yx(FWY)xxD motif